MPRSNESLITEALKDFDGQHQASVLIPSSTGWEFADFEDDCENVRMVRVTRFGRTIARLHVDGDNLKRISADQARSLRAHALNAKKDTL